MYAGWCPPSVPMHVGQYYLESKLGEGGMGVVYAATDERLARRVAIKFLNTSSGPDARARLVREAQLVAGISDPAICQVYDLGEWEQQPFVVMELVDGEPLTARLGAPMPPADAVKLAVAIAGALASLHRHGVVHRDLKPSNIFVLRGEGTSAAKVKLLDFGLARPILTDGRTIDGVTLAGTIVGTPQYAAPEQLLGEPFDARADLFSAGVILFEMLSGRPPFGGATFPAIMHAVLHETPPALVGGAAMPAVDRVIRRALSKKPADRFGSAEDLVAELRQILPLVEGSTVTAARALTRLAVLPFRLLKPDAEIEYLVLSLADVIASALAGLESLVVRPSIKTAQYANQVPDLEHVAADLAVDVVLVGSILRVGERLRVSAQLMTAPAGDTLWTHTMQLGVDAVFELHEELSQRVIDALPLTIGDQRRGPKVRPTGAKAFDLYMRGMQLRLEPGSWEQARALFDQSATLDPAFAPAWAERGRLDRVLVKYGDRARLQDAEHAFHRALEIDPDNGTTHYYQAQLEIDVGRADAALMRLVERAAKHRAEPQVYAGLVHACRYAGLLDQSIAAHLQARRLDPTVATSVLHTYYLRGDFQRALEEAYLSTDPFEARVLGAMGRRREAIDAARREEARFQGNPLLRAFCASLGDALAGDHDQALAGLRRFESSSFADGEGLFYLGEIYAAMGADDEAIAMLDRAAAAGFICVPAFLKDPYLSGLHAMRAFTNLIGRIESRQQKIAERFAKGGGARLLIL